MTKIWTASESFLDDGIFLYLDFSDNYTEIFQF